MGGPEPVRTCLYRSLRAILRSLNLSHEEEVSIQTTERSRAYPVLTLEDGRRLIREILAALGDGAFSREVLGEILGYSNAHGGPGARKIAALAQYGFLRRKARLYSTTPLARAIAEPGSESARGAALRRALRQPPLFGALLDRYAPQGRVPSELGGVLWRDYGITRKASRAAAETFRKSARYAGVIDRTGAFVSNVENRRSTSDRAPASEPSTAGRHDAGSASEPEQRFEFALTKGRVARLFLPVTLCRRDLEIIQRQIDFLECQVNEEDGR